MSETIQGLDINWLKQNLYFNITEINFDEINYIDWNFIIQSYS